MDSLTNLSGTLSNPFSPSPSDPFAPFGGSLSFISSGMNESDTRSAGVDDGGWSRISQEEESEPAEDEFATIDLFSAKEDSSVSQTAPSSSDLTSPQYRTTFSAHPQQQPLTTPSLPTPTVLANVAARDRNYFSVAEDACLIETVSRHGRKWTVIAAEMSRGGYPKRNPKGLREHYDILSKRAGNSQQAVNPLPYANWTAEEDAQLLHLDKTFRSSSSSSGSTSTPSIDWAAALPFFPGRSADELKKRCAVVRQKTQKAEAGQEKKEENERATLKALKGFGPILPKPLPVVTSQSLHASSSRTLSTAASSSSVSNPLLLKFKLTASPLPPLPQLTPKLNSTRGASLAQSLSPAGPVFSSAPPSSSLTAFSSFPPFLQSASQPLKTASTSPTKPPQPQPQRYKPYPLLWEDRDVRKKVRGIAAALRASDDEEEDEVEKGEGKV